MFYNGRSDRASLHGAVTECYSSCRAATDAQTERPYKGLHVLLLLVLRCYNGLPPARFKGSRQQLTANSQQPLPKG